jgi:hypothetical protein
MGVIRKTASIGTLGVINFRSKKEKLQRSERALLQEHAAREAAEQGLQAVGSELRRLSDAEVKAARQLARLRRRSRKVRKADRLTAMLNTAQPMMAEGMEVARKQGRRARKAAKRASHEMKKGAEKALDEARSVMAH